MILPHPHLPTAKNLKRSSLGAYFCFGVKEEKSNLINIKQINVGINVLCGLLDERQNSYKTQNINGKSSSAGGDYSLYLRA